jgi:hypothetical protein
LSTFLSAHRSRVCIAVCRLPHARPKGSLYILIISVSYLDIVTESP